MEVILYFLGIAFGAYGLAAFFVSIGLFMVAIFRFDASVEPPLKECNKILHNSLVASFLSIITLLYVGGYFNV